LFEEDAVFFVGDALFVDVDEDFGVVEELSIHHTLLIQRLSQLSELLFSLLF